MAVYSIRDLEQLSGIKAHTLRIWELRYEIIVPKRTPTNIRYYDEQDLKNILNIALLNKNGYKISKIAEMTAESIAQKVSSISEQNREYDIQLDALTIAMIEMNEDKFERILAGNIEQLGFERTMLEVINPFLDKLGLLWLSGSINPAQEHFISYLIRRKIIVAIDQEQPARNGVASGLKFLLFLPEGEKQELSLLFMHYLLSARGHRVVYLGQSIPLSDLKAVHDIHKPNFVFSMISETFLREPLQKYVNRLCEMFSESTVLLSGYQVVTQVFQHPRNMKVVDSLQETLDLLNEVSNPINKAREDLES